MIGNKPSSDDRLFGLESDGSGWIFHKFAVEFGTSHPDEPYRA